MVTRVETGRESRQAVLLAGGTSAIPRWSLDPAPGVTEHVAILDDDLAALSGEHGGVTGRLRDGPGGRPLLQDAARVESDLLQHWGFAADELEHIAEHSIPADLAELLHREHT
jgi:hypothetical protein